MIKAVVFDLDDTLYPEYSYVDSGFKAVDRYLACEYSIDGFYVIAKQLFDEGHRGRIFNDSLDSLKVTYQNDFIKHLVCVYRNHKPEIKLDVDTSKVLKYFSKHYKTALITDGYKVTQRNKIEALGISHYFKYICVTDELGIEYWKPHEKSYLTTECFLNVTSSECVYVADNPTKDFVTPNKLGWKTVKISSEQGEYCSNKVEPEFEAQFQIDTLNKLNCLIASF